MNFTQAHGEHLDPDRHDSARRETVMEICEQFGIEAFSEQLSDGSRVWNVMIRDEAVECLSQEKAEACAIEIGEAIMRAIR